jgi:ABC-type transport system involved in multi-copper enzyme maturation permease subunit
VIGLAAGARIYTRMSWMRLKRGRLVWAMAVLWALPLVYVGGLALAGHWGRGLFDDVGELYFRFLVPFVPALMAASAVAEEIENKTFTFVFARPTPRAALVIGKWAAATLPSLVLVVPSLAVAWLVAHARFAGDMAETWPHLLRVELAAAAGLAAYGALATALGTLFSRHPMMGVLGYLLVIELGLGSTPIVLHLVAIGWHLRNLAELAPASAAFLSVPAWLSALLALGLTPALLALTGAAVAGAEYRTDRA